MKRNYFAVPSLAALLLLGCGGPNRHDTGANAGSETGAAPGGTSQVDTTSLPADTGAMRGDVVDSSARPNPTSGDSSASR